MPLPDLIEIVPLDQPVHAEITVPGSKSITNRALILAALAEGETTLEGALWSEDTQVMVECLQELGFMVNVAPDSNEAGNRTITVYSRGGTVPRGGTAEQPLELFVGNAGTAARFLAAFVCLGEGVYRLHGVPRMHERPQESLFQALRELGYRIDAPNDKLPALIHGDGPRAGKCRVSIEESSQFASALLLSAVAGGWQVEIAGENAEESPYVKMTAELIKVFPQTGGRFQVEPDASSGSYFLAATTLVPVSSSNVAVEGHEGQGSVFKARYQSSVSIAHWPTSGWQIDERFMVHAASFVIKPEAFESPLPLGEGIIASAVKGARAVRSSAPGAGDVEGGKGSGHRAPIPRVVSRLTDLGDGIMTLITIAPLSGEAWKFTDLGRLRVQECERVVALRTELSRCGAKVVEAGDTLTVFPARLHGAEIETYNDHRMAMCFAILGLKVPGIRIKNPACVKKTFPNFFQKLAAPPPKGLGATIRDGQTGRGLALEELFAA